MNYYDDLLNKLENLIENLQYEQAYKIIEEELSLAYIPKEVEEKLHEHLLECNASFSLENVLSDEQIESYLKKDNDFQLRAVDELNKKNLRDYIDLCNEYLKADGFLNAKVLLIDSLIRQEINFEFTYNNNGLEYHFIPKYVLPIEESDGYIQAKKIIEEEFLKDPSQSHLSLEILYKECMLHLPINFEFEEGNILAQKIIHYVKKAFES